MKVVIHIDYSEARAKVEQGTRCAVPVVIKHFRDQT